MFVPLVTYLFKYLFTIYAVYKTFIFVKYVIYLKLIAPYIKSSVNYKETGQWAVVTGCTDGIGKSFTFELAKIGMDLILISRSEKKLDDLAKQLSEKFNIKTKIIVADFTNTDKVIPIIESELDDLDIGVLINNVGISTGVSKFLSCNQNEITDMIEINIKAAVRMCSIVMPKMVEKKCGVVINMSSLSSVLPCPHIACYGATKAFMLKFSQDLCKEYKQHGITVHCLKTSFVATKMTNIPVIPWLFPSPDSYAANALKTVGISDVTTGYSSHDFFELYSKIQIEISESLYSVINEYALPYLAGFFEVKSTAGREPVKNGKVIS